MSTPPGPQSRIERVLEAWYLCEQEGRPANVEELCNGDAQLAERVTRLLRKEPAFLQFQGSESQQVVTEVHASEQYSDTQVGEFRILHRIASGGMGTVFLAEQERMGRQVALKVVDRKQLGNPQAFERLQREASITGRLNHPNIVPVYAIGEEDDHCFIAMRFLEGPPLNEAGLPLDPMEAARIGIGVANALDAAHRAGVVHRDVKPSNILLDAQRPYLVDFGLARSTVDPTLTSQGSVPGTLPYMAPELFSQNAALLDPRCDVYALGATLYELAMGRPPFLEKQVVATASRILLKDPPPLRLGRRHKDFETIVLKALEKDPNQRIQSALELAADLQRYLQDEPILSQPTTRIHRLARHARRYPKVTTMAVIGSAIVLALFVSQQIARRGERKALDAGVQVVSSALDQGDVQSARQVMGNLLIDHPQHEALSLVADRVKAEIAADRVFTSLLQRPLLLDWSGLENSLSDLEDSRAFELIPGRARPLAAAADWTLGRESSAKEHLAIMRSDLEDSRAFELIPERARPIAAAADWTLGRESSAKEQLAIMREDGAAPLAVHALSLLMGEQTVEDLPEGNSDEHVTAAMVLFLLDQPFDSVNEQVRLALRLNPESPRASYAKAAALVGEGEFARASELIENHLGSLGKTVEARRLLLRIQVQTGRFEKARATLEAIPRDERGIICAFNELEILHKLTEFEEYESRLAEYRQDFPSPCLLDLLVSQDIANGGRDDEAFEMLERLIEAVPDPTLRDQAEATMFQLAADRVLQHTPRIPPTPDELGPLIDWGLELWETLEYRQARGIVAWRLGLLTLYMIPAERGLQFLEKAHTLLPNDVRLLYDYSTRLLNLIEMNLLDEDMDDYFLGRLSSSMLDITRSLEEKNTYEREEVRAALGDAFLDLVLETSDWMLLRNSEPFFSTIPETPKYREAHKGAQKMLGTLFGPESEEALWHEEKTGSVDDE